MDHPFIVAFIIVCGLLCCLAYCRARRQTRTTPPATGAPDSHHFIQLRLPSIPRELPNQQKPKAPSSHVEVVSGIRQSRAPGPLLCDICRERLAVGYTEGATGEPDSITVYCRDCAPAGTKFF
jgi:hypothetical protein